MDKNGEPLKSLNKFRFFNYGNDFVEERKKRVIGPPLSINCGIDETGILRVGDEIWILDNE